MKKNMIIIVILILCGLSFQPVSAQNKNNQVNLLSLNEPELPSNAFNLNPLSFLTGSVSANYEHVFGINHGFFIEGSYSFGKGRGYSAGYRYHYGDEKDNTGIFSSYWGLFITSVNKTLTVNDSDKKMDYDLDVKLLNIGVNWGTRSNLGGPFNFAWRIGYGFPVNADFTWAQKGYKDAKTFENVTKFVSGIDAEISFGIQF